MDPLNVADGHVVVVNAFTDGEAAKRARESAVENFIVYYLFSI